MQSFFFREHGFGRRTWSAPFAIMPLTGKGVLLWTHPGSQGWRPVGGLVMHGGLLEIGVPHKFVYGEAEDQRNHRKALSVLRRLPT